MSSMIKKFQTGLVTLAMVGSVHAATWIDAGLVGQVEGSYIPMIVSFKITPAPADCTTGNWMIWVTRGSTENERLGNNKAIYAALIAAQAQMTTVTVAGTGCSIEYFYSNPN